METKDCTLLDHHAKIGCDDKTSGSVMENRLREITRHCIIAGAYSHQEKREAKKWKRTGEETYFAVIVCECQWNFYQYPLRAILLNCFCQRLSHTIRIPDIFRETFWLALMLNTFSYNEHRLKGTDLKNCTGDYILYA